MLLVQRKIALLVFASLALAVSGCGSNNAGKIVGKWKATTIPGMSEDQKAKLKQLGPDAVSVIMEFTEDGRMTASARISMFGQTQTQEVASAKYSLSSGDWVVFSDLKPVVDGKSTSRDKIVIQGDTMTIETDKGEKITLNRMTADTGAEPPKTDTPKPETPKAVENAKPPKKK